MAIRLSGTRCEEIKRIVVNMFLKYHVSCIPINGFEIAGKMGIKCIPYSAYPAKVRRLMLKKSTDGFSALRDDNRWFIFYNDEKGYGRINNTIMHEIAHIVLDHSEESELAEKEVNFFAKYALAPPVLIHKLHLKNIQDISDVFEISFQAAYYAYQYYQKWLAYGNPEYTDYEVAILQLFDEAS